MTCPEGNRIIGLARAEARLRERATALAGGKAGPVVVGITGPVAGGKSTLAARLASGGGVRLTTDRYLPDYERVETGAVDEPEQSDLARLRADLSDLAAGEPARVPVWSFQTHRREGEEPLGPARPGSLVVVEGLHAIHGGHADLIDVRVMVDAPAEERLERWLAIARRGERGWGVEKTREFFHETAELTFERFRPGYEDSADLIVWNSASGRGSG